MADLRSLLAPEGHLACAVASADRKGARGGFGYYDLLDALEPEFPVVRMFGETPFFALGIAEFDGDEEGLRVDANLIDPEAEEPTHYIALAGATAGPSLGYALVQLPAPASGPRAEPVPDRTGDPQLARKQGAFDAEIKELNRRLTDAEGRADGALRVSRAQADEIEELRARLRRAAEMRAELDEEVARLRKALSEVDASVVTLTRKTADEMSALAQKLTSGLRPAIEAGGAEASGLRDKLRQHEATLAQKESAIYERDERIALLEAERQDLLWRTEAAESHSRQVPAAPLSSGDGQRELALVMAARDRAQGEFRHAATLHMQDAERLRAAVAEQAAHAMELEEALAESEERAKVAIEDAERGRVALTQAQEADRTRRARLAELEGTLLRLRRQASEAPVSRPDTGGGGAELEEARALAAMRDAQVATLEAAVRESERDRLALEQRCDDAVARLAGLEAKTAASSEALRLAQEGAEMSARVAEEDVARLRTALERSDEQLREARGQLLPLKGRIALLEREIGERDQAERDFVEKMTVEVGELEAGIKGELESLTALERSLDELKSRQGQEPSEHVQDLPVPR